MATIMRITAARPYRTGLWLDPVSGWVASIGVIFLTSSIVLRGGTVSTFLLRLLFWLELVLAVSILFEDKVGSGYWSPRAARTIRKALVL